MLPSEAPPSPSLPLSPPLYLSLFLTCREANLRRTPPPARGSPVARMPPSSGGSNSAAIRGQALGHKQREPSQPQSPPSPPPSHLGLAFDGDFWGAAVLFILRQISCCCTLFFFCFSFAGYKWSAAVSCSFALGKVALFSCFKTPSPLFLMTCILC